MRPDEPHAHNPRGGELSGGMRLPRLTRPHMGAGRKALIAYCFGVSTLVSIFFNHRSSHTINQLPNIQMFYQLSASGIRTRDLLIVSLLP